MKNFLAIFCICNVVCYSYGYVVTVIKYLQAPDEGLIVCYEDDCYLDRGVVSYEFECEPSQHESEIQITKVLKNNSRQDRYGDHYYEFGPRDQEKSDYVLRLLNMAEFCSEIKDVITDYGPDPVIFATSPEGSLWIHIEEKPELQTHQCFLKTPCYNKDLKKCCSLEYIRRERRLTCPLSC